MSEYEEGYAAGVADTNDVWVSWSRHAYARVWVLPNGRLRFQTNYGGKDDLLKLLDGVSRVEDSLLKDLESDEDEDP